MPGAVFPVTQKHGCNVIKSLFWTGQTYSPHLNPIENLWGTLINVVYAEGKQYKKIKDLEIEVQLTWRNI